MTVDHEDLYRKLKGGETRYEESIHCPMILQVMSHKDYGTVSKFCVQALIGESTFYDWVKKHEIFKRCYQLGKMLSRENWEEMGRALNVPLTEFESIGCMFEYWRMIGWSRFGVGKNSRIRLDLNVNDSPNQHYSQLLGQASEGDFTAGEIKQLMEAINVGLNAHQVFELQRQIDEMKEDLKVMGTNKDGTDRNPAGGFAEKNTPSLAGSLC